MNVPRSLSPKIRTKAGSLSLFQPLAQSSAPPLSPHSPLTRAILGIWTWLLASRHETLNEQNLSGDICKHCTEMSFLFDSWILACPRNVNTISISSSHKRMIWENSRLHCFKVFNELLCHPQNLKGVFVRWARVYSRPPRPPEGGHHSPLTTHHRLRLRGSDASPGRRRSADSECVSTRNQGGQLFY